MSKRRLAREHCLQSLYLADLGKLKYRDISSFFELPDNNLDERTLIFAQTLLSGTLENINRINTTVSKYAKNWTIERMSSVDRCILRLATFELLYTPETPVAAVIDEAIEIAKKYSTDKSSKFINGVLDNVKRERTANEPGKRD